MICFIVTSRYSLVEPLHSEVPTSHSKTLYHFYINFLTFYTVMFTIGQTIVVTLQDLVIYKFIGGMNMLNGVSYHCKWHVCVRALMYRCSCREVNVF